MHSPSPNTYHGVPSLLQSRARPTITYANSPTSREFSRHRYESRTPFPLGADMNDASSISSSPSLHSRPASHIGHTLRARDDCHELEPSPTQNRISMVSGPRVTKYADIPWEDFHETTLGSGNIGRVLRATLATGPTLNSLASDKRGLRLFARTSSSGVSLASTQSSSASSDPPVTPNKSHHTYPDIPAPTYRTLDPSLLPLSPKHDRPLLSSGSPGFGLISLEAAQERERLKAARPRPTRLPLSDKTNIVTDGPPLPPRGVKQKKSLMKLFKHEKSQFHLVTPALPSVPTLPTSELRGSVWSETSESTVWPHPSPNKRGATLGADLQRLELRPISMNFSNALPPSLLSDLSSSPPPVPPLPTDSDHLAETIKEQIANARKGWMVQLFELEAQIRELKDELQEAKSRPGSCETCGCTCGAEASVKSSTSREFLKPTAGGMMDRGRAKTGGARGVFGSGSLYEWE